MKNTMLHMKLNSAVSVFAVAAAFSVLLPPSNAFAGICFLPDCGDDKLAGGGDINMNINEDSEYCENKGYTYYSSGQCPQYQAKVGTCSRDDHYLKCDPVKWCTDNGYNTQTCSLPSFVDGQCPNGKPYYKQCKEDRPRACREAGYVNSCSSGRLYATTNRCPYDKSYGKCCTASPSAGCPSNYSVNCDASRGSSGTDTCGYTCYRCCSDECSRGSKNYSGSKAGTTECGSICRYCSTSCSSGSTSYSGSVVGYNECGSACRSCSTSCPSGTSTTNPGGCGGSTTNECGTKTCYYPYQSCHSHSYSCPSGYSTSCSNGYSSTAYKECSCGATSSTKCYKCNAASSGGVTSGSCCGYASQCGTSGTTSSGEANYVKYYGKSYWEYCTGRGGISCQDMWSNCRASGGTPVFQGCSDFGSTTTSSYYDLSSWSCS